MKSLGGTGFGAFFIGTGRGRFSSIFFSSGGGIGYLNETRFTEEGTGGGTAFLGGGNTCLVPPTVAGSEAE